jgi:membrane-associated phospholipid phosphatase
MSLVPRPLLVRHDPHAPSRRHTLLLAAAAAGSVALTALLVANMDADEQWAIDARVRDVLRLRRAPRIRRTVRAVGRAGTMAVYAPLAVLAMAAVAVRRGPRRALPIGAAVGGAALGTFVLKHLVQRPRPVGPDGPVNSHPSFPSGHATRATALVSIMAYVAVRERIASALVVTPIAAAVALATGASRAYADAHWTTDIVGGWAAGVTSMAAAALMYERIRAEEHR